MTDEEVEALLPVVDEFVGAVGEKDARFIEACLKYKNRAPAFAVILADLLIEARETVTERTDAVRDARKQYAAALADNERLRTEIRDLRDRVKQLRDERFGVNAKQGVMK